MRLFIGRGLAPSQENNQTNKLIEIVSFLGACPSARKIRKKTILLRLIFGLRACPSVRKRKLEINLRVLFGWRGSSARKHRKMII